MPSGGGVHSISIPRRMTVRIEVASDRTLSALSSAQDVNACPDSCVSSPSSRARQPQRLEQPARTHRRRLLAGGRDHRACLGAQLNAPEFFKARFAIVSSSITWSRSAISALRCSRAFACSLGDPYWFIARLPAATNSSRQRYSVCSETPRLPRDLCRRLLLAQQAQHQLATLLRGQRGLLAHLRSLCRHLNARSAASLLRRAQASTQKMVRPCETSCGRSRREDERARGGTPFRGLTREREEDARVLRSAGVPTHGTGAPT